MRRILKLQPEGEKREKAEKLLNIMIHSKLIVNSKQAQERK
jgi:hypothetical protein